MNDFLGLRHLRDFYFAKYYAAQFLTKDFLETAAFFILI